MPVVAVLLPRLLICRRTRTAGARTSPTTSRRRSSSIARTALSGSSPATELAPMRHPLATTHGGARSAPAAHLGSGRSRPAGPRRQTRLEAQALGTVPIRALLGPEFTPHLGVETVENLCRTAGDWAGSRVPATLRPLTRLWEHSKGGRAEKSSERARTSAVGSPSPGPPSGGTLGAWGAGGLYKLTGRPWCSTRGARDDRRRAGWFLLSSAIRAAWGWRQFPEPPGLHERAAWSNLRWPPSRRGVGMSAARV
jgi:hypothetical protein